MTSIGTVDASAEEKTKDNKTDEQSLETGKLYIETGEEKQHGKADRQNEETSEQHGQADDQNVEKSRHNEGIVGQTVENSGQNEQTDIQYEDNVGKSIEDTDVQKQPDSSDTAQPDVSGPGENQREIHKGQDKDGDGDQGGESDNDDDDSDEADDFPLDAFLDPECSEDNKSGEVAPDVVAPVGDNGARPKTAAALHKTEKTFAADVFLIFSSGCVFAKEVSETRLTVTENGLVVFKGTNFDLAIEPTQLRWTNSCWLTDAASRKKRCIFLSYQVNQEICVIAFEPLMEHEEWLSIFNELMQLKYSQLCEPNDRDLSDAVRMADSLPIYAGFVKVTRSPDITNVMFVTLDIEAIVLYPELGQSAVEQLMFWQDNVPESIDIIKRRTAWPGYFTFVSKKTEVMLPMGNPYNEAVCQEVIDAISNRLIILCPRPRKVLQSVPEMSKALKGSKGLAGVPIKSRQAQYSTKVPVSSYSLGNSGCESSSYANVIVNAIKDEVAAGERIVSGDEDMQMMWITIDTDLRECAANAFVPTSDYDSGGLSPDEPEHFKKALDDVVDQLRECRLPEALSRMRACINLFRRSSNMAISSFLMDDEHTLLKKMYFRSIVA